MKDEKIFFKTKEISKKFGNFSALDDVSMTIHKGEIYGFIGENGAGKTTLIRLITKLMKESHGKILVNDEIDKLRLGAIIETPAFYPYLSAEENLMYYSLQMSLNDSKKRIKELLDFVGLNKTSSLKYKNYSMGMKQRLGLALALLNNPNFLILDEPTNGLDPLGIIEYRELIRKINYDKKTTVLISSHILSELSLIATRYGIIHKGKLIRELSMEELTTECKKKIYIDSSDNNKAIKILENNQFTVKVEGIFLTIENEELEMKHISKLLFDKNIYLKKFFSREETLEDYYMRITNGIEGI